MDVLPYHLLDKILFRLDQRSLSMMRCTNRSLNSHTHDLCFESEYFYRVGSGLVHISSFGSNLLCYLPYTTSRSTPSIKNTLLACQVLASCSGLLLLFVKERLCVANPLTKRCKFLNKSSFMGSDRDNNRKRTGLAVNQIDRTTQSFSVVHLIEINRRSETRYRFQINSKNSWRYSKTEITCKTSNLDSRLKTPVYFDGSLHWLRDDGGVLAFNPKTGEARLIPVVFPKGMCLKKTLFAATNSNLVLILATREVIDVYTLERILSDDPKWVLARHIPNIALDETAHDYWNVEAYDGKCLVLWVKSCYGRVVLVYDLSDNKWRVVGSIPGWCDIKRDVFQFTMSLSCVVGLDEQLTCDDERMFCFLRSIMGLIDGNSHVNVGELVRKDLSERQPKRRLV